MSCCVAVIGAGPAGSVFASVAAAAGMQVILLDPLKPRRAPIGESLAAPAVLILRNAGFVPSGAHGALGGTISLWAGTNVAQDALGEPFGAGLRLDRARFDAELRNWALSRGVRLERDRLRTVTRDEAGGFLLGFAGRKPIRARYLVDASGRAAFVARRLGSRRRTLARLFCVHGRVAAANGRSTRALVESVRDGWWYAVALPSGLMLAAFHTDAGTAKRLEASPGAWLEELRSTRLIAPLFQIQALVDNCLAVADASSTRLDRGQGAGWIAIGDAAGSFDPISSHGLFSAIRDGLDAATALLAEMAGVDSGLREFERARAERHLFVERQSRALYRQEIQWADASFWALRHC